MSLWQQVITKDRVALITGAANGIGRAAAVRFAKAGMKLCLVDVNIDALTKLANSLGEGENIIISQTDVTDIQQMTNLREEVYKKFGEVALLMNNAGVSFPTSSADKLENWKQIMDVNFWGVVNGQHAFVPSMVTQNTPCLIVNTGSKQGITNPPGNPAYNASKAAVKAITEQLAHELRQNKDNKVGVHLLVPGFTWTGLTSGGNEQKEKPPGAWTSDQVVDALLAGITADEFYIICQDNEVTKEMDKKRVQWALGDLVEKRPALSRWHPDYADKFKQFMQN